MTTPTSTSGDRTSSSVPTQLQGDIDVGPSHIQELDPLQDANYARKDAAIEDEVQNKSEDATAVGSLNERPEENIPADDKPADFQERTCDFLFLPIPKSRRYNPDKPFHFSMATNYLFAFASTFTVANLYYCQPLQVQYSESFGVSYSAATHVPALLQGGYAGGLLLITPLGDLVRRRTLVLLLILITTILSIGLAVAQSWPGFQALNFLSGLFTVAPQVLIPLAADLAPSNRRAQTVAIVLSGLLLGILVARVLAGIIAEFASWRDVYYMAIGTQAIIWASLWYALPDYPPKNPHLNYFSVFGTMAKFLFTNPVLVQGCITSGLGSAVFSSFWVTLTFLLTDEPYQYSTLVIGLFGLVGITGVCTAPFVGKLVDSLVPWVGVVFGNLLLIVCNLLLIGGARVSIAFVIISIFFLDLGQQFQQVSNQTRIFSTNPQAGARLNSIYIIAIFFGQLIGSSLSSKLYLEHGPRPFYALNLGFIAFNLAVLMARGPVFNNKKWLGWGKRDEWSLKKKKSTAAPNGQELKQVRDVEEGRQKDAQAAAAENSSSSQQPKLTSAKS